MLLVIACEIPVCGSQILPIDEILKVPTHEGLCFFSCHTASELTPAAQETSNTARTSTHDFPNSLLPEGHLRSCPPDSQEAFCGNRAVTSSPEKATSDCCKRPFQFPESHSVSFLISYAFREKRHRSERRNETKRNMNTIGFVDYLGAKSTGFAQPKHGIVTSRRKMAGIENPWLVLQFRDTDALSGSECMRIGQREYKTILTNVFKSEMLPVRHRWVHEPQVDSVSCECLDLLRCGHNKAGEPGLRMPPEILQHNRGKVMKRGAGFESNDERLLSPVARIPSGFHCAVVMTQCFARPLGENFPRFSERERTLRPLDKRGAHEALQALDLTSKRRLRNAEFPGSSTKM